MKRSAARRLASVVLAVSLEIVAAGCSSQQSQTPAEPLITGKIISPSTQSSWDVGNLPMNLLLTPDGKYAITSDMGYFESLWSIRTADGKGVSHVDFSNILPRTARAALPGGEDDSSVTQPGSPRANGLYYGLAISRDNIVYASQGAHDSIAVLQLDSDGKLTQGKSIPTRPGDFPAGLALDDAGHLYVANNSSGTGDPLHHPGSVAIYDTAGRTEVGRYTFSGSYGGTSNFPLGIAVLRGGGKAYVAAERDDAVYVLDTRDPSKPALAASLATGARPVAVLLSADQSRLYVANSLSDTISVVDTATDHIIGTILLRPDMARDLPGVTPTALALSPDGKTLYASLGDMNAVAVIDPAAMQLRGYIPTGWYPSSLAVSPDGKRILVANAKGTNVRNPNNKPDPHDPRRKTAYILNLLEGNVTAIRVPSEKELADATEQVLDDNRLTELADAPQNPLARISRSAGKIQHVIYIIKENRTYDQVLGDLPQGNGDPSLVLFGKDVTPNQHALAERFVLLDDLYACGEVSGDGWVWSTQGMADAYVVRNVPYNYSHRGRSFDFEGQNNGYPTGGFPATDADGKPLATTQPFDKGATTIPDVASTGRTLWDSARQAGVSMRNFGFFLSTADKSIGIVGGPDNFPTVPGLQPPGHDLAGVSDTDYRRFDLDFPDSDAPVLFARQTGDNRSLFSETKYGKYDAPSRFSEWNREFQMMLARDLSGSAVPGLMMIRLPNDHTAAAKAGKHSPASYVADNDYALGQIVEAVSHSPIWTSTAIFVIEDDAQSGVDHVDAHRTTGFVISPWIKSQSVDHQFHNTDGMLRTIELLLGIKPLSQYDAVADPILDWNDSPANAEPYVARLPAQALISQINPFGAQLGAGDPRADLAARSDKMELTHADAAPADELDEIIWKTVKGAESPLPTAHRTLSTAVRDDDDD